MTSWRKESLGLMLIGEYCKTLEKHPNPKPVRLKEYGK